MPLDERDTIYLERALELAELGRGLTTPNPVVGAVIVSQGEVVGEGYHTAAGRDHAEIAAMKDAVVRAGGSPPNLTGATIYVTLEPCCNWGRTPPCVPALVDAGFARVVVGAIDPSPQVNGRGIEQLREAGVRVDVADGALNLRCKRQNDGFRKSVVTGLPFVTYKYAMTVDGRIACDGGDSKWISGPESRLEVHRMRSQTDAVMVGAGTLRVDDPLLTAREVQCRRQPLRVVVDPGLSIRREAALVRTAAEAPVLIVCSEGATDARKQEVRSWGVEVLAVPNSDGADAAREPMQGGRAGAAGEHPRDDAGLSGFSRTEPVSRPAPGAVARALAERGVQTVLLEGGAILAGAWWSAGLVDKIVAFVSARVLSGTQVRSPLQGAGAGSVADGVQLREVEVRQFGEDICLSGYVSEAF